MSLAVAPIVGPTVPAPVRRAVDRPARRAAGARIVMVGAFFVVGLSTVTDIVVALLDPRIKLAS
jgi:hypothetical protein